MFDTTDRFDVIRASLVSTVRGWRKLLACSVNPDLPCTMDDESPCDACRLAWDLEDAEIGIQGSVPDGMVAHVAATLGDLRLGAKLPSIN